MQNFEKLAEINAVSEKIKSFKKDATELALRKKKLITEVRDVTGLHRQTVVEMIEDDPDNDKLLDYHSQVINGWLVKNNNSIKNKFCNHVFSQSNRANNNKSPGPGSNEATPPQSKRKHENESSQVNSLSKKAQSSNSHDDSLNADDLNALTQFEAKVRSHSSSDTIDSDTSVVNVDPSTSTSSASTSITAAKIESEKISLLESLNLINNEKEDQKEVKVTKELCQSTPKTNKEEEFVLLTSETSLPNLIINIKTENLEPSEQSSILANVDCNNLHQKGNQSKASNKQVNSQSTKKTSTKNLNNK
jgi:hypothetical protein